MSKPIQKLTLLLPHGVSVDQAQKAVQILQKEFEAGISSGGFEILEGSLFDDEAPTTWSDTSMIYEYGHSKRLMGFKK